MRPSGRTHWSWTRRSGANSPIAAYGGVTDLRGKVAEVVKGQTRSRGCIQMPVVAGRALAAPIGKGS